MKEEMNLTERYNELYKTSVRKIQENDYRTDSLITCPNDKRFGITLIIRPPEYIKNKISLFLEDLRAIDPSQYYYPDTDIHITVLSIISCYDGFRLDQISSSDYINLVKESMFEIDKFHINLKGITASDSTIMVQGFPENKTLDNLRNSLRKTFQNSNLQQSIDKRYSIQTAHCTVVRFCDELQRKKNFLEFIEKYRSYDFGSFEVNELELVFNDWYQRKENSELLMKLDYSTKHKINCNKLLLSADYYRFKNTVKIQAVNCVSYSVTSLQRCSRYSPIK